EGGGRKVGVAEVQTLLHMGPSRDELTAIEGHHPFGHMALDQEDGIVLTVRQVEELLTQFARDTKLCLGAMKPIEAMERLEELRWLPHLVAQGVGPGVDLPHFRRRHALRYHQALPQDEQQREFVVRALGTGRERR